MRGKMVLVLSLLLVLGGCVVYPLPPDPALDADPDNNLHRAGPVNPPPAAYGAPPGAAVIVTPPPVYGWPPPVYWYPPPRVPRPGPWVPPPGPPPR